MNILILVLTRIMMGRVMGTSNRMTHRVWWRIPTYFILVGCSAWVALASALFWTSASHPGVVGLLAYVQRGGPAWLLSIPLVALLAALATSLPAAGRYGPVLVLVAVSFGLTLAGMATFQGDGHSDLNVAAFSCAVALIPCLLVALVTALADLPPVDSPLAYTCLSYFGRVGHLRAMVTDARRLGWDVEMPWGAERVLATGGAYGDEGQKRAVLLVSGATMSQYGPKGDAPGYWYKLTAISPRPLPSFRIAREKVPPEFIGRAVTGKIGRRLTYYVIAAPGQQISPEWTERFARQVCVGAPFLQGRRDAVQIASGGLVYTHFRSMRLSARSGHFVPQVEWLVGLAQLLEEIAAQGDVAGHPAPELFAEGIGFGRLTTVDPTSRTW